MKVREHGAEQKRRQDARVRDSHRGVAALAQQRRIELEPDQEHVKNNADLGNHVEEGSISPITGG